MKAIVLFCVAALVLMCCQQAFADVYLHMLRGSNNRLDEANRDRANGNRLFDSQNNNRGGYNVGSSYHYVGEKVRIEWTNQHSCNAGSAHCDLVLQMMCDDWLRDGTTTNRIPNTRYADADPEYGRHESYDYYQSCTTRERNQGLFTASQNLDGETAQFTRQNPNGERHGFECPEERDYYPYWHPTPWIDIAIMTSNMSRCENFFQKESQNVKHKGMCFNATNLTQPVYRINNRGACEALRHVWREFGAWNMSAPECVLAPFSRENHLGNTFGGETPAYHWTVPDYIHERCALRLRYNISTDDYPYDTDARFNDEDGLALNLAARFKSLNPYPFENNPTVDIGNGIELELAINTAQFGRTFQDRSHRFSIRARPDYVPDDANLYALMVRGKRGNIVQTFPGTEYDFTPNELNITTSDYVHLTWTGSNTNPNNNDGQGREQSDRSNVAPLHDLGHVLPAHLFNQSMWNDTDQFNHRSDSPRVVLEFVSTTGSNNGQLGGELSELDDAATYFDAGVFKMTQTGTFHYMSTRNNNFSNRQQKATLVVSNGGGSGLSTGEIIGIVIAAIVLLLAAIIAAILAGIYFRKQSLTNVQYSMVAQAPADPNGMYIASE